MKVTIKDMPRIKKALKPFAKKYLAAKLKYELEEKRISTLANKILERYDFKEDRRRQASGEKIVDYKMLYLTEQNTDAYYAECEKQFATDGYWPNCVAEMEMIDAARNMVNEAEQFFGISFNDSLCNIENHKKYIKLLSEIIYTE